MKLLANKRVVIVLAVLVIGGSIAVAFLTPPRHPNTTTTHPTVTPSATPTVQPSPGSTPDGEEYETKLSEDASQPFVTALPKETPYWSLTYGGKNGDKYVFRATVYYGEKENPDEKVKQQEPFIVDFLRKVGQPDGTYVIQYKTQQTGLE